MEKIGKYRRIWKYRITILSIFRYGENRNIRSILSIGRYREYRRTILSMVLYGENREI